MALVAYLREYCGNAGPHLVLVPKVRENDARMTAARERSER